MSGLIGGHNQPHWLGRDLDAIVRDMDRPGIA